MRPEEFDHFIITDQGTAMLLQDDVRLAIAPIKDMKGTFDYNGIQIYPIGIMYGQNRNADIFDKLGKTAIFVDPLAPFRE